MPRADGLVRVRFLDTLTVPRAIEWVVRRRGRAGEAPAPSRHAGNDHRHATSMSCGGLGELQHDVFCSSGARSRCPTLVREVLVEPSHHYEPAPATIWRQMNYRSSKIPPWAFGIRQQLTGDFRGALSRLTIILP